MAVQLFEKANGYSDSEQFLGKLGREIWRLHEAQFEDDIDEILDHGINAAITAWHLHEIVAVEFNLNKEAYRNTLNSRCIDLGLMHDIATYAKHLRVTRPQRRNSNDSLQLRTIVRPFINEEEWEESKKSMEFFGISISEDSTEYSYRAYRPLKIDDREVEEILVDIKYFWTREIKALQNQDGNILKRPET